MNDLLKQRLKEGLVIFDGAMGTEIYRRNFFVNASYEELNLSRPEVISEIHQSYIEAGAEVLTTNTFNANARNLERFGIGDKTALINQKGVELARRAAGETALVAGSIGPVPAPAADQDSRTKAELILQQAQALKDADFLLFESIRKREDLLAALDAMAEFPEMPFAVSFALDREGDAAGEVGLKLLISDIRAASRRAVPTACGLNCGGGPELMLGQLELLRTLTKLPVIVQPNAGAPRNVDGRMLYMTSNEYFTTYANRYVQAGASAVGGCCGITPQHIAELVRMVKPLAAAERRTISIASAKDQPELPPPAPLAERSPFGAKLAAGKFVVTVEITPPRGFDLTKVLSGAKLCKENGIDAVNIPDGPRASARITPLATAAAIIREVGITAIAHCCCRDRSLIGLQSELLGYAGSGVHDLLFITGDPPKLGNYPFSTGVFDLDSIGLVKIQNNMNRGVDLAGEPLNAPTHTVIGVGADPNVIDPDREYERLARKVEAGADFIITQPVFTPERLLSFLKRIEHFHIPVIAGIWPLVSLKNAEFMRTEVPGVVLPDEIMHRMAQGQDRDSQRAIGIEIAREMLAAVRDAVQGVQLSSPFGNVAAALKVLE